MSYMLEPKDKTCESIDFGCMSWPHMLEDTGMGYILNYGKAKSFASYIYDGERKGSPVSNDGFEVTASEAKMMARVASGYVFVKEAVNKQWAELSGHELELHRNARFDGKPCFQPEVSEEFLDKLRKFIDFANKSKGFYIK